MGRLNSDPAPLPSQEDPVTESESWTCLWAPSSHRHMVTQDAHTPSYCTSHTSAARWASPGRVFSLPRTHTQIWNFSLRPYLRLIGISDVLKQFPAPFLRLLLLLLLQVLLMHESLSSSAPHIEFGTKTEGVITFFLFLHQTGTEGQSDCFFNLFYFLNLLFFLSWHVDL